MTCTATLKLIRAKHPELADTALVYVSTPDYIGAFQDGWAQAVTTLIEELAVPAAQKVSRGRSTSCPAAT